MYMRITSASLITQRRYGERPTESARQIAARDASGGTQTIWVEEIEDLQGLVDFIDRHGRVAVVDYGWTAENGERIFDAVIWEEGEPSPFNY
jgi:hypothetical protein